MREITLSALTFESCVRMSSWMPSTKKASSSSRLRFSKGSTAMDGRASVTAGDASGCAVLCRGGCVLAGFAGALVVPERPAAEQQEQREDRELGGGDALLAAVAVVPGEDQDDGQADQECEGRELLDWRGQSKVSLTYSRPCRNPQAAAT